MDGIFLQALQAIQNGANMNRRHRANAGSVGASLLQDRRLLPMFDRAQYPVYAEYHGPRTWPHGKVSDPTADGLGLYPGSMSVPGERYSMILILHHLRHILTFTTSARIWGPSSERLIQTNKCIEDPWLASSGGFSPRQRAIMWSRR
jgi:hypothetical protein